MIVRNMFRRFFEEVKDPTGGGAPAGSAAPAPSSAAPAPAAPAPVAAPAAGGDGKGAAAPTGAAVPAAAASEGDWGDWRTKISGGDEKMQKRLERYNSPKQVAEALASVQQRISAGELRSALAKDAKPEEIAAWRTENGIPEAPDKYALKLSDGLVIGTEDKPIIDNFLKSMHGANASNDVASKAVDWYYQEVERQTEARAQKDQQQATSAQDALRAEWGNEYRPNINMIEGLLETAPNGVKDNFKFGRLADGTPIMADPDTIRWINGLARQINPVTTVVPNAGADVAGAIDTEIASIEKKMGAPKGSQEYKAYWESDKTQARYRELLGARERVQQKKP